MLSKTALVAQGILIAALLYLLSMLSRHVTNLDERVVVYFPPQIVEVEVEVEVEVAALGREVFVIGVFQEQTWFGGPGVWQFRVDYSIDGKLFTALHTSKENAERFVEWLGTIMLRVDNGSERLVRREEPL